MVLKKTKYSKNVLSAYYFSLLYISVISMTTKKQLRGKKGLFQFTASRSHSNTKRSQGRNLEAEVEEETMEDAVYWLTSLGFLSYHLLQSWPSCPRLAHPIVGWALPHQLKVRKCPTDMPTGQLNAANLSVNVPSFRNISGLGKLTKTNQCTYVLQQKHVWH